jgi:drug/metabolite transporter (DMT)-like permease
VISYVLALSAGLVNATSNVLNRKAVREEPDQAEFRLKLIFDLMRRRVWLAAVAMMAVSFALAAAALGAGQLASVQLIVVLELPMTIIGGALLFRTRLDARTWTAIAMLTTGVIALLALLDPRPGTAEAIAPVTWITMSAANIGACVAFFFAAKATRVPAVRASLLGVATGLGYGLTAAYTKGFADKFVSEGITGVLTAWQFYATIGAGVASAFLLENAYQAGPLTASQPGITLVDPLVSTIWGIVVFGETTNHGLLLRLTALPAIALAAGVFLLSSSPVLRNTRTRQAAQARGDLTPSQAPGSANSRDR